MLNIFFTCIYSNKVKNWFLTTSAFPQNFGLHSSLASRQWSLAPDKNSKEPPCQIPNFSLCLSIVLLVHFSGFLGENLIPPQENRGQLLEYIQQFSEEEYFVVETEEARFYVDEEFNEEIEVQKLFERFVTSRSTVIEYGAKIGGHIPKLSRLVGLDGHVVAFEPDQKIFRELVWNMILNEIQNVSLYFQEKKMDELDLKNVSLIHIDANGREDIVLKGAKETIAKNKPALMINALGGISPDKSDKYVHKALIELLEEVHKLGYTTQNITKNQYLALPIGKKSLGT